MSNTIPLLAGGLTRQEALRWRNGIFMMFGMLGFGIASWVARVPAIKSELSITTAEMGLLMLALALGSMFGLVLASHLIERFETRTVLAVALVAGPVGLACAGIGVTVGQNFTVAFAGLALFGVATAIADVAVNLSGAVNERVLGRTIMPVFHAFFSIGAIVGAAFGALAEVIDLPLAVHICIASVVTLAGGVMGALSVQSEHILSEERGGAESTPRGWRERLAIWKDPRTVLIGLVVLGMAFSEGAAGDWISLASVEGHGFDQASGALVFGVFVTAMLAGRLAGPPLLDRFGRSRALRVSAAVAIGGLALFIFAPASWLVIVGTVLWGLGAALGLPTAMSAAADNPRNAAARVTAVATIGYFGFLAGPPLIGFLGEHVGILHALLSVTALLVVAGLAAGATKQPRLT